MNNEGAKTPPLPPEEIVQEVAIILAKHRTRSRASAIRPSIASWIQP